VVDTGRSARIFAGSALAIVVDRPRRGPAPTQLAVAAGAVVLVTAVDWVFDRATGRPMPVWSAVPERDGARRG
jgi:hypothetical protein